MKKILIIAIFVFCVVLLSFEQVSAQAEPEKKICISQEAANKCAEIAREKPALENKIKILEEALEKKDSSFEQLRQELVRAQIELATKTGQLIATEAENVRMQKIIEALLPMLRKKKIGLINLFE